MNWNASEEWYDKPWARQAWLNHRFDPQGRFLKLTARRCPGLERECDKCDRHVWWGIVALVIVLVIFGARYP